MPDEVQHVRLEEAQRVPERAAGRRVEDLGVERAPVAVQVLHDAHQLSGGPDAGIGQRAADREQHPRDPVDQQLGGRVALGEAVRGHQPDDPHRDPDSADANAADTDSADAAAVGADAPAGGGALHRDGPGAIVQRLPPQRLDGGLITRSPPVDGELEIRQAPRAAGWSRWPRRPPGHRGRVRHLDELLPELQAERRLEQQPAVAPQLLVGRAALVDRRRQLGRVGDVAGGALGHQEPPVGLARPRSRGARRAVHRER